MAVRRTSYPQVEPRAATLMTRATLLVPPGLAIEEAGRLAARRGAELVAVRAPWRLATRDTLAHARRLGLDRTPLEAILWPAVVVAPACPEIEVRRRLRPGRPAALVVDGDALVGAVLREAGGSSGLPLSLAARLDRLPEASRGVLRLAGALGQDDGHAVAVVGGLVRDLLLSGVRARRCDVDLVVEGNGPKLAARLGRALGTRVIEHPAFLTATLETPGLRIDVATARRETYPAPGALPAVAPAPLAEDLARRDFSINAVAARLDGARWGDVVDPAGGVEDARRRQLRILHPLSFVEDPIRIFRAGRLAVRLACRLEPGTRRLARLAAGLDAYAALSGDRLREELRTVLAEPEPAAVIAALGRLGAFQLLTFGMPDSRRPATWLRRATSATRGLALTEQTREALALAALTTHLAPAARQRMAGRLGLSPGMRETLAGMHRAGPTLARRLAGLRDPAAAYRSLRGVPEPTAAWALTHARPDARRTLRAHLRRWRELRPLLRGDEVAALGLDPGPAIGRVLAELLAAQAAGRVRTRTEALAWARATIGRPLAAPSHPRPDG